MTRICITCPMLFVAMFYLSVVAQYPTASPKASVVITIGAANSPSPITPPSVSPSLPPSSISSPPAPAHAPAPHKSGAASHGFSFATGTFVVALVAAALII